MLPTTLYTIFMLPKKLTSVLHLIIQHGTEVKFTNDPIEAVQRAHVVVTDTWVSMGQEAEKEKKLKDFAGYQVTRKVSGG